MSENDSRDHLTPRELVDLQLIVDEFEEKYIAGAEPRIEDFEERVEHRYRRYVVISCVDIELEQAKSVTHHKCNEYLRRFPDYASQLWHSFEQFEDRITEAVEEPSGSDTQPMPSATAEDTETGFPSLLDGDNYTFIRVLGGGKFGTVYLAHSKKLDQNVAIKVLRDPDPGGAAGCSREVQVLRSLNHPNIVKLLDVTQTRDSRQALVQEYIEGKNLSEYINSYRDQRNLFLPWEQSVHLTLEIARALVHVHEEGVFHADLKPANILLREVEGHLQPLVADFGLSMLRWQRNRKYRGFAGTFEYASPEHFREESPLPHVPWARSDIYSLGVILYRLLTNRMPFENVASPESRIIPPEPPRSLRAEVPLRLSDICLKCLEFNPEDRFSSAVDVAESLEALVIPGLPGAVPADPLSLRPLTHKHASFYRELLTAANLSGGEAQIDDFSNRILPDDDGLAIPDLPPIVALSAPSGAGKSSWFSAGVLPRLRERDVHNSLTIIRISAEEANSGGVDGKERTVDRLRRQLCLRLGVPVEADKTLEALLQEWMNNHAFAERQRSRRRRRLLIVIDQFEQWLSVHGHKSATELERAVRLCDVHHIQVLLIFRSDPVFLDTAMEFMNRCGCPYTDRNNGFRLKSLTGDGALAVLQHLLKAANIRLPYQSSHIEGQVLAHAQRLLESEQQGGVLPAWIVIMAKFIARHAADSWQILNRQSFSEVAVSHLEELFESLDSTATSPWQRRRFRTLRSSILAKLLPIHDDEHDVLPQTDTLQGLDAIGNRSQEFRLIFDELKRTDLIMEHHHFAANGELLTTCRLTHEFLVRPIRLLLAKLPEGRSERCYAECRDAWWINPSPRNLPSFRQYVDICRNVPSERRSDQRGIQMLEAARRHHLARIVLAIFPSLVALACLTSGAVIFLFSLLPNVGKAPTRESLPFAIFVEPFSGYFSDILLGDSSATGSSTKQWASWIAGLSWTPIADLPKQNPRKVDRMLDSIQTLPAELRGEFIRQATRHRRFFVERIKHRARDLEQQIYPPNQPPGKKTDEHFAVVTTLGECKALQIALGHDAKDLEHLINGSSNDYSLRTAFEDAMSRWMVVPGIASGINWTELENHPSTLAAVLTSADGSATPEDRPELVGAAQAALSSPAGCVHVAAVYALRKLGETASPQNSVPPTANSEWKIDTKADIRFVRIPAISGRGPEVQQDPNCCKTAFWASVTEVSRKQFHTICPQFGISSDAESENRPAANIGLAEIFTFLNQLNINAKRQPVYRLVNEQWEIIPDSQGFRLPHWPEFLWMAGAGHPSATPLGSQLSPKFHEMQLRRYARFGFEDGSNLKNNTSIDVGTRRPNSYGLHDVLGNVAELQTYPAKDVTGMKLISAEVGLVIGGGSFDAGSDATRLSTLNFFGWTDETMDSIGFRIIDTVIE